MELDPRLAEAHASLGFTRLGFGWDWQEAQRELQKAIELNPAYPTARQWYACYLETLGRGQQARDEIRQALSLDPLSPVLRAALARL